MGYHQSEDGLLDRHPGREDMERWEVREPESGELFRLVKLLRPIPGHRKPTEREKTLAPFFGWELVRTWEYAVSEFGAVRRVNAFNELMGELAINRNQPRPTVNLNFAVHDENGPTGQDWASTFDVARLVLMAHVDRPRLSPTEVVEFIDGDPGFVWQSNLRWRRREGPRHLAEGRQHREGQAEREALDSAIEHDFVAANRRSAGMKPNHGLLTQLARKHGVSRDRIRRALRRRGILDWVPLPTSR